MTISSVVRPRWRALDLAHQGAIVAGASAFIAASAQISIRLPFSPVPVTAQTLAVLLVGALLGSRLGTLAVLAYLWEGAAGLPVFASGAAGVPYMVGPTGGYLLGFVAAAFLAGRVAEFGRDRRVFSAALAMLIGNLAIYAFGLAWLANLFGVEQALTVGWWPFVPGDLLKLALGSMLLPSAWRLLHDVGQLAGQQQGEQHREHDDNHPQRGGRA